MEDLPIERGICASRVRSYTEGAIQRTWKSRPDRLPRAGKGTVYKSVSSVQLIKNSSNEEDEPSLTSPLCKSCDQFQGGITNRPLGKKFVSSVNIALAKPQLPPKSLLPHHVCLSYPQKDSQDTGLSTVLPVLKMGNGDPTSDIKTEAKLLNDSSNSVADSKEKEPTGSHQDENNLPWEASEEFPHIPVLVRIKQFEKQTGALNNRSFSPQRWKRKGRPNCKKSFGSVHSSPPLSRRSSVEEKVMVRNSRNSSPAIVHLQNEVENLNKFQDRAQEEPPDNKTFKPVAAIPVSLPTIIVTSPHVSGEQGSTTQSAGVQVDAIDELESVTVQCNVSEEAHSVDKPVINIAESVDSLPENDQSGPSSTICQETEVGQERTHCDTQGDMCQSEHCQERRVNESTEVLLDSEKVSSQPICVSARCNKTEYVCDTTASSHVEDIDSAVSDKDTNECAVSKCDTSELDLTRNGQSCDCTATDTDSRDHPESVPHVDTFALDPVSEIGRNLEDDSTERKIHLASVEATSASEEPSGKHLNDSSSDCQPFQHLPIPCGSTGFPEDLSPELQILSPEEEVPDDIQCNISNPLLQCVTAPTNRCQSDEGLQELHRIQPLIDEIFKVGNVMDTDIYSQRCSQQLGECGSESEVLEIAVARDGLAPRRLSGDSSPCLSDCYSSSASDEESLMSDGMTPLDFSNSANSDCSIRISQEVSRTEGTDLLVCQESTCTSQTEEPSDTDSGEDTDDSLALMSESESSDSLDCTREVLASNQIPDLSSSLGACGGVLPLGKSESATQLSADRITFSRHLSALTEGQHGRDSSSSFDSQLNADQKLFLSKVNHLMDLVQNLHHPSPVRMSVPSSNVDKCMAVAQREGQSLPSDMKAVSAPPTQKDSELPTASRNQPVVELKVTGKCDFKPRRHTGRKKYIDPDKVSHFQYLILQSPLVLSDPEDSDSDESDVELNEFGEVKQDYPLGRLPDYIVAQIFRNLGTRDLAALKCACKDFKWLIERFDIKGLDSRWSEELLYREDPCMQCGKIRDPRGDVSLCRWHPKIYYKNGEIGRRYWTCCFSGEEDAPGCDITVHDNRWSGSHSRLCKVARSWRQYWRSYPMDN
ncbi:uncharacterized protein LOC110988318 [Acanthaster planci]|uniref:Uncharacterized protein LOC110988318 n=1 Tax=Acanthaster planci TaxID=133434 RepID=A0A8B7ZV38_ACAPL|nr:uncharacterized protein LOC110988318 [Acanthaster planci]XP_022107381.1 uncharacterized protein LOC110988318 [Acanthaster planci]XP_022107382.1 uncharacterized protein LOC110988318 [Acanthaster planci]XP_022107383.1 uncharacterized protein LOC110988318 [Acanthaster planci]